MKKPVLKPPSGLRSQQGGRPLQTTLNEKKEARVLERVMELLTIVHQRVSSH